MEKENMNKIKESSLTSVLENLQDTSMHFNDVVRRSVILVDRLKGIESERRSDVINEDPCDIVGKFKKVNDDLMVAMESMSTNITIINNVIG